MGADFPRPSCERESADRRNRDEHLEGGGTGHKHHPKIDRLWR
jgi:hypothetical protein